MSIIWILSSPLLATTAYILPSTPAMLIDVGLCSASNPFRPSYTADAAIGLYGSVMSIIWTLSSPVLPIAAYALPSISAMFTDTGYCSASNPFRPSRMAEAATGL